MFSKSIQFMAIGDIVTDAFIRLKEAHVTCNVNQEQCQICMKFGDKIPFESATIVKAVGNSANAAVSASRLGLSSALMTNIGGDDNGRDCIKELSLQKINTKYVTVHKNNITNYHYVLWYGEERTILVKHEEFSYKLPTVKPNPQWVYVSSLASNSLPYQEEIISWLEKNPDIKVAFQPGTFQMSLGIEKLKGLYKRSDVFFCNKEEAQRILNTPEEDIKKLMSLIHALGPKTVVVTDGSRGAYVFDGNTAWFMPTYPDPKPPYERTGAGDAFASTFVAALGLGKSIEEALMWAPINSTYVVQDIGAQRGLLTRAQIEEFVKNAPADYKPRVI